MKIIDFTKKIFIGEEILALTFPPSFCFVPNSGRETLQILVASAMSKPGDHAAFGPPSNSNVLPLTEFTCTAVRRGPALQYSVQYTAEALTPGHQDWHR